jgi:hypothetical protein
MDKETLQALNDVIEYLERDEKKDTRISAALGLLKEAELSDKLTMERADDIVTYARSLLWSKKDCVSLKRMLYVYLEDQV